MNWTFRIRIVNEQNARDDVVVGRGSLENARDRMMRNEVLLRMTIIFRTTRHPNEALIAGNNFQALVADLKSHFERLHARLL